MTVGEHIEIPVQYVDVGGVVYINLDSRTDRNENMLGQLSDCRWPIERLSATRLERDPEEHGLKMLPRLAGRRGVASIWLSHKAAIERLSEHATSDDEVFVLLEDDVVINNEFWLEKLQLPAGLPPDWELLLLTPKYRWRDIEAAPEDERNRNYAKAPSGGKPTLLSKALKTYLVSGAHFVVFRNRKILRDVIAKMEATPELFDVDLFYARALKSYGVRNRHISSGGFGSDHD